MEETKFRIGDFSRLCRVPASTLRYYDEIGLFKAAEVDTFTGYRFYTVDQLAGLNCILALRDLGFTLDQIADQLQDNLSLERMQGMLQMKKAEIQQQIEKEQARLARVETRLQMIEQQGQMPDYEIILKDVQSLRVVRLREVLSTFSAVEQLLSRIYAHIGRYGSRAAGAALTLYHDAEFPENQIDMEAAVPVQGRLPDDPPITMSDLPGCQVVATVHNGGYFELWRAWHALGYWVASNGFQIAGPSREIYLREGPGAAPEEYVTEIQIPVSKPEHT